MNQPRGLGCFFLFMFFIAKKNAHLFFPSNLVKNAQGPLICKNHVRHMGRSWLAIFFATKIFTSKSSRSRYWTRFGMLVGPTWMSCWKLGSMVSKWVISPTYKWGILGLEPTDPNHLLTSNGTSKYPFFCGFMGQRLLYAGVWTLNLNL